MSADNYLVVDRETFKVYMAYASQDYASIEQMHLEGQGKTLEEAIEIADKIMFEEIVEYGISFCGAAKDTPLNLDYELNQITYPELRQLVEQMLHYAPAYFWVAPASRRHHYPDEREKYGTVLHTKRAFIVMKHLCEMNNIVGFDQELLLCAILVHDICKNGVSEEGEGRTVGDHENLLKKRFSRYINIISHEYWPKIVYLVSAHMGIWGRHKPITKEQQLVHLADYISTRSNIKVILDNE